ncbi:MAG: fibronectin type III domain-containing protein [Lachnospiraceae bacterium]|nr:fibronectin type III domain-containing protein [Lachnospiraceae bacterium]
MIKRKLAKKLLTYAWVGVLALGTVTFSPICVDQVMAEESDEYQTIDVKLTDGTSMKKEEAGKISLDIKDNDIWLGEFYESPGSTVTSAEILDLISEDDVTRIMDTRLTDSACIMGFEEYEEDGAKGDKPIDLSKYNVKLELEDGTGIIHENSNVTLDNNKAILENKLIKPTDELKLTVPNQDKVTSEEGYFWFKLNTSMLVDYTYDEVTDVEKMYGFVYHMVDVLDAAGKAEYTIDKSKYLTDEAYGNLEGVYACATLVDGKPSQIVGMYNVVFESDLKIEGEETIYATLGKPAQIAFDVTSSDMKNISYSWIKDGEDISTEKSINIDSVRFSDLGKYTLYAYDGIDYVIKTVTLKEDPAATHPTLGKTTGLKLLARGTYALKISWNKVKDAKGYIIYIAEGGKWVRVGKTTKTAFLLQDLDGGSVNKIAVKAYGDYYGATTYGTHSSMTEFTKPLAPGKMLVSKKGKTFVTTKWSKINGASGYYVYKAVGGKWVRVAKVKTTTYTFKNLKRNTSNKFAVRPYKTYGGKTVLADKVAKVTVRTAK